MSLIYFSLKPLLLILVFVLLVSSWYESNTWLQFSRGLTKAYNLTDSWVCIHFPSVDTQLSLAPVSPNESIGFLGNWTQSLDEVRW